MIKNFFEYVKEVIPEKGQVFFTIKTHTSCNALSLYQLVDLLQNKKITSKFPMFEHVTGVSGYSWNVHRLFKYDFDTIGLFLEFDDGTEKWIHFSKDAFIGAICILATQNDITFDDEEHEALRNSWANQEESVINKNQSNFDEKWYTEELKKANFLKKTCRPSLKSDNKSGLSE